MSVVIDLYDPNRLWNVDLPMVDCCGWFSNSNILDM